MPVLNLVYLHTSDTQDVFLTKVNYVDQLYANKKNVCP